jgi:hypothetical protein
MGLRARAELSASSTGSTYRQAGPLDLKTQAGHAMQTPNDYDSNLPSSNPTPSTTKPHVFPGKTRVRGRLWRLSRRLTEMFLGSKAAHKTMISTGSTCRHGRARTGMKAKAIGQKCEKPWENQGLPAERTGTELSGVFPMFCDGSKGANLGSAGCYGKSTNRAKSIVPTCSVALRPPLG